MSVFGLFEIPDYFSGPNRTSFLPVWFGKPQTWWFGTVSKILLERLNIMNILRFRILLGISIAGKAFKICFQVRHFAKLLTLGVRYFHPHLHKNPNMFVHFNDLPIFYLFV